MEKYLIWYKLWLKLYVKKKSYWFQMLGIFLAIGLIMMISIPDSSNVTVGLYFDKNDLSEQMEHALIAEDSVFSFQCYDDKDELEHLVLSGELECAFLFDDEFEEKVLSGNLKKSITYMGTSFSTKGEVAKEVVYTALLKIYSDEILRQVDVDLYEEADSVRLEKLLEKKEYYLNSGELFQLEIKELDGYTADVQDMGSKSGNTVKGIIGLFVFLSAYFAYSNKLKEDVKSVCKKFIFTENLQFSVVNSLAAGTVPVFAGLLIIFFEEGMSITFGDVLGLLLLLLCSAVWVAVLGTLWTTMEQFFAWILPILVCNLLLCPIFFDLGQYVPAVNYLRLLFPLGIYLTL